MAVAAGSSTGVAVVGASSVGVVVAAGSWTRAAVARASSSGVEVAAGCAAPPQAARPNTISNNAKYNDFEVNLLNTTLSPYSCYHQDCFAF
jgi:hypothetical protein